MSQEICKHVTEPKTNKIPYYCLCSISGLRLQSNGNGSFVCPDQCRYLRETIETGQRIDKNGKVPG